MKVIAAAGLILALCAPALAGLRLTSGGYSATPAGGSAAPFTVTTGGSVLENWIDDKEYVWHDSPPPSGSGYYMYHGPPVKTVTFSGSNSSGSYGSSPSGSGTYQRNP